MDRSDLEREQDVEELRRIGLAQHAQLQLLMELVEKQPRELGRTRSQSGNFQLTLKMLEQLKAKAKQTQHALTKAESKRPERKPRSASGPTEQPRLPIIEQVFTLDTPDRMCPSCGGELRELKDRFDECEMIDVVEVSCQLGSSSRSTSVAAAVVSRRRSAPSARWQTAATRSRSR